MPVRLVEVEAYPNAYHAIDARNPPTDEERAAAAPPRGPKASSARYGTMMAHAMSVQLVAHIVAMIDELLSAKSALDAVQTMTTERQAQPWSSFFSMSRPRLPLAICSSAEAVDSEAETIASAKSC